MDGARANVSDRRKKTRKDTVKIPLLEKRFNSKEAKNNVGNSKPELIR